MQVTLYHNPKCSKSRQALQLLQEQGITPEIIEYLHTSPSVRTLEHLCQLLAIPPRALMRSTENLYKELNLQNTDLSDGELLKTLSEHPQLLQRPIVVVNDNKAVIARPPEKLLEILS